jgi:hypothetical protein
MSDNGGVADLRGEMLACAPAGRLRQVIDFGYELACRPD